MLCSCTTRGEHCGHKKGDSTIHVHPLMPSVEDHFFFGTSGNIAPAPNHSDQAGTATTIEILGLDCEILKNRRREAIGMAIEEIANAPNASIQQLQQARNGRHVAHVSAISAVIERITR